MRSTPYHTGGSSVQILVVEIDSLVGQMLSTITKKIRSDLESGVLFGELYIIGQ